jgi:hypothetical protein
MVKRMLKKCATEAIKLTSVNNMSKPALILLLAWTIAVSYYHGMRHGIEIGVDRSAIKITCHKAFGEIK